MTCAALLPLLLAVALAAPARAGEQPLVIGTTHTLHSEALGEERQLHILPPLGVDEPPEGGFPVVWVLDGGPGQDLLHVAGLLEFLSMYELMPRSWVVGVHNVDRYRDFTSPSSVPEDLEALPTSGGSAAFLRFLLEEARPLVDGAIEPSGHHTLVGQSLGGLLVAQVFLEHPGAFDALVAVSPSFWWDGKSLLTRIEVALQQGHPFDGQLVVVRGDEGEGMDGDIDRFAAMLDERASFAHELIVLPEESHATVLHRAVYRAMEALHGDEWEGM